MNVYIEVGPDSEQHKHHQIKEKGTVLQRSLFEEQRGLCTHAYVLPGKNADREPVSGERRRPQVVINFARLNKKRCGGTALRAYFEYVNNSKWQCQSVFFGEAYVKERNNE